MLPVDELAERLGVPVFVKPESLQRVGAFKLRGAFTLVRQLKGDGARGVITYSSGNHGQAVAYAARALGCRAVVVMPANAPQIKAGVMMKNMPWKSMCVSRGMVPSTGKTGAAAARLPRS